MRLLDAVAPEMIFQNPGGGTSEVLSIRKGICALTTA